MFVVFRVACLAFCLGCLVVVLFGGFAFLWFVSFVSVFSLDFVLSVLLCYLFWFCFLLVLLVMLVFSVLIRFGLLICGFVSWLVCAVVPGLVWFCWFAVSC